MGWGSLGYEMIPPKDLKAGVCERDHASHPLRRGRAYTCHFAQLEGWLSKEFVIFGIQTI